MWFPSALRRLSMVDACGIALVAFALGACGGKDSQPAVAVGSTLPAPAATVASSGVQATPAGSGAIEFYSATVLSRAADEIATGSTTTRTIGAHPTYHYIEARRSSSGVPEVHDRWIDVTIVQAGRATLLTGGRVDGSHLVSAGEHRGGAISGGTSRPIASGDFFVIPAGIPHQYQIARGDSVRYLTIKVERPAGGG